MLYHSLIIKYIVFDIPNILWLPENVHRGQLHKGMGVVIEVEWEILPIHSADQNGDGKISLVELLRVIQFFNSAGFHCADGTEDGYNPGPNGEKTCRPHASDYNPRNWEIGLTELLRLIQFFNSGGYHKCEDSEDGYCPSLI